MNSIQDVLAAWGRSRALSKPPNGLKPPGWTAQIQNPGEQADRTQTLPLGEEFHLKVDEAVSALRNTKPDHYRVILLSYQYRKSDKVIAQYEPWQHENGRVGSRSRSWVRAVRENAEHWIEGRIGA